MQSTGLKKPSGRLVQSIRRDKHLARSPVTVPPSSLLLGLFCRQLCAAGLAVELITIDTGNVMPHRANADTLICHW